MNRQSVWQASEAHFQRVIEANADGIVIVNQQGMICFVNPAAEIMFARPREMLVNEIFGFPVVADETTEIDIVGRRNEKVIVEMRVVDILWQNETAYLASLRDITVRKKAEEALRAREQFLAWLNEITHAALETSDYDTMLQNFADRLGELFKADGCYITRWDSERGQALPGALNRQFQERFALTPPDLHHRTMTTAVLQHKRPLFIENLALSPFAQTHTALLLPIFSALALPLIAGEEKLGAAFIIFQTEHNFSDEELQRAEQVADHVALALSKARLLRAEKEQRELAETLIGVISVLNSSLGQEEVLGIILEQLAQVVAYDSASVMLLGGNHLENVARRMKPPHDQFVAWLDVRQAAHIQEMFRRHEPMIIPETAVDPRWINHPETDYVHCWLGVPLVIQDRVVGLLNLNKTEPGFYSAKDAAVAAAFLHQAAITIANAQLYKQVQSYADELEVHVAKRTQELQDAYRQIQELDRLKTKFIDDISHELRTPLTNLGLYLDLITKGSPANHPRYLSILYQQTERLKALVEGILRLSHLDLDQSDTPWQALDLNQVVAQVVDRQRPLAEKAQLTLTFSPHPTPLLVRGNAKQLAEMFAILVNNAIIYTPSGQVMVRTTLADTACPVLVEVRDTGIGIAAEDLPYVFERFYRGQGASQSNLPGMGLGLTIAKGIAELHKGNIQIASQQGQGTRIQVNLPND
jgi:signal transduction histidine kinase